MSSDDCDDIVCLNCGFEGNEKDLIDVYHYPDFGLQDKFATPSCPKCKSVAWEPI